MAIQIGAKLDSGFDDPLGMLKDCHRRIENFLRILRVVAERSKVGPLDDQEAAAVRAALRYFRTGGQRHTADEEMSLFPRISASLTPPAELSRLEADHHTAEALHQSVENLYTQWIAEGGLAANAYERLLSETEQLSQLYAAHIRVEEDIVFPHAAFALDAQTLAAIGAEFEERRKVS